MSATETAVQGEDVHVLMSRLGAAAKDAAETLATAPTEAKDAALRAAASALRADQNRILDANAKDMAAGEQKGLTKAMLDRLMLDPARIEAMAAGLEAIAELPDPVGTVLAAPTG